MLSHDPHSHPDVPLASAKDYAFFERMKACCEGQDIDTILGATSRIVARAIEGLPDKI